MLVKMVISLGSSKSRLKMPQKSVISVTVLAMLLLPALKQLKGLTYCSMKWKMLTWEKGIYQLLYLTHGGNLVTML